MPNVLIVDGDREAAAELARMLGELWDGSPVVVDCQEAALAAVAMASPELILIGMRLSRGEDGIAAAAALRAVTDAPLVFISRDRGASLMRAAALFPAGYLSPPFQSAELDRVVGPALGGRCPRRGAA